MIEIGGVYEVAVRVRDLARAEAFYRQVLGLEMGLRDAARRWVFLRAGGIDGMVVLQEDAGDWPGQHLAFRIREEELGHAKSVLEAQGVAVEGPVIHEWIPATSLYFRDPDGHDLELCAPLRAAPREGSGPSRAALDDDRTQPHDGSRGPFSSQDGAVNHWNGGRKMLSMDCPLCDSALSEFRAHGIDLDRCPRCEGVWFDIGELAAYRENRPGLVGASGEAFIPDERGAPVRCPRCRWRSLSPGRAGKLRLFFCGSCGGAFVSKPEAGSAWSAADFVDVESGTWVGEALIDLVSGIFSGIELL